MNHNIMRLKQNEIIRNMCVDTNFLQDQLIQPIFISEKNTNPIQITGLDDNYVMNLNDAKIRIYPNEGHNVGRHVYGSGELYDWMFRQKRP